jgi:hypothetical protein
MASGKVEFPAHMQTVHADWLDDTGTDDITTSVTKAMTNAIATSPYTSKTSYDPDTALDNMDDAVVTFAALISAIDFDADWGAAIEYAETKIDALIDDSFINAAVNAQSDYLDDELDNKILPKFRGGMRDVNAVMSSAFVIGESVIMAMKVRDVAKFRSDLSGKLELSRNEMIINAAEGILRMNVAKAELQKTVAHYTIEANRLRIVATKEQTDTTIALAVGDGKWDLELYQYGANVMASISGAAVIPSSSSSKGPTTAQSAIGGALAGAAIGSELFGKTGGAVGAGVGLGLGLLFG